MRYIGDIKKLLGDRVHVKFKEHNVTGVLTFAGYSDLSRMLLKQNKQEGKYYTITVDRYPIRVPTNNLNKLFIKKL